jgi:hypothetical protein
VRQPNTLRPKAFQQLRNSEEPRLHVFRQGKQLSLHQIIENFNCPLRYSGSIALLLSKRNLSLSGGDAGGAAGLTNGAALLDYWP